MHCLPLCSTSDFLGRSRFTTLWVTLACCRIAATSYVQNSSLGGKGLLARVTQTRPDQELIQCWWTNPVLWLTCIRAISHWDTRYTSLSPPSPPPQYLTHSVQDTGELCRITVYCSSQNDLWLSGKFSQSPQTIIALYEGDCILYSAFLLLVSQLNSFLAPGWQLSLYHLKYHSCVMFVVPS